MTYLAKQIRRRRVELGYTQEELAKKIGYMTRASINKIENGVNDVPWYRIEQIAEALNCTPAYLTEGDDKSRILPYNGANGYGDWLFQAYRKATLKERGIVYIILSEYAVNLTDDIVSESKRLLMAYRNATPKDKSIVYTILSEYIADYEDEKIAE